MQSNGSSPQLHSLEDILLLCILLHHLGCHSMNLLRAPHTAFCCAILFWCQLRRWQSRMTMLTSGSRCSQRGRAECFHTPRSPLRFPGTLYHRVQVQSFRDTASVWQVSRKPGSSTRTNRSKRRSLGTEARSRTFLALSHQSMLGHRVLQAYMFDCAWLCYCFRRKLSTESSRSSHSTSKVQGKKARRCILECPWNSLDIRSRHAEKESPPVSSEVGCHHDHMCGCSSSTPANPSIRTPLGRLAGCTASAGAFHYHRGKADHFCLPEK